MLTVQYDAENGVVESILSGTVSPEDIRQKTESAVLTAQANDCYFFLSDLSQAEVAFSANDVQELPAFQEELGLDPTVQIAIIAPESESGRELVNLYETICFYQYWSARVFNDRQTALNWLLERC